MKTIIASTVLAFTLLLTGCGGGDSHESLAKEMLGTLNEFATVMEGVTDEASAKAAAPKLESLATKLEDIAKRIKALPATTEEENNKLMKNYLADMRAATSKADAATMKLAGKPEVQKPITDAINRFNRVAP